MASKSKPKPVSLTSRLLELPEERFAKNRSSGFTFTDQDADLFALGYPHLCLLFEDEGDPVAIQKWILGGYPFREVAFGRRSAIALLRAHRGGPAIAFSAAGKPILSAKAVAATEDRSDLEPAEAAELLKDAALQGDASSDVFLYLVEALLGSGLAVEYAVSGILSIPRTGWFRRTAIASKWLDAIAMMLARMDEAQAAPSRDRLRSWAEEEGLDAAQRLATGMDALCGEPVVAPPRIVVTASREMLVAARTADATSPWYTLPDPRLVFLGGDDVYRIELGLWAKYGHPYSAGRAHQLIVERFGRIRSPLTVALMADMAAKSKAKPAALDWFDRHAVYAAEPLEALVRTGGDIADTAKAIQARAH